MEVKKLVQEREDNRDEGKWEEIMKRFSNRHDYASAGRVTFGMTLGTIRSVWRRKQVKLM